MGFSFIHMADIHLGRPFSDLSEYSLEDKTNYIYKHGVEIAFNNAVKIAIEKNVDFVLIAGDTFDSEQQDFNSKLILKKGLDKLNLAGIKVFLICGNHDPISSYNKNTFNYDENSSIKIIGLNTNFYGKFFVENNKGENEAVIHAFSYKEKKIYENPIKYFEMPNMEEQKLFNIGLLHTSTDYNEESPYAPCKKSELKNLNYDYWALGHNHIPDNNDNIVYSGTIQGRNTKETGSHGIKYVRVENKNITENIFIPTDTLCYENTDIDISDCLDDLSIYELIKKRINLLTQDNNFEKIYLLRITLNGSTKLFDILNENIFTQISENIKNEFHNKVFISSIENNTFPVIEENILKQDDGIIGKLYENINNNEVLKSILEELIKTYNTFTGDCEFSQDFEDFKEEVIQKAKKESLNLCEKVYEKEAAE